jgi:hypothetical protein
LPYQAHPVVSICRAVISASVRGASDDSGGRRRRTAGSRWIARSGNQDPHDKVGPAASVYPDPARIISPGIAFRTRRSASLVHHAHAVPRIGSAIVPFAVIGSACQSRAISIGRATLRREMRRAQCDKTQSQENESKFFHSLHPPSFGFILRMLRMNKCIPAML